MESFVANPALAPLLTARGSVCATPARRVHGLSGRRGGFTLIELMVTVALVGLLSAIAVFGVARYFASAKTAEAKSMVGAISIAAASAYEREKAESEVLLPGGAGVLSSFTLCDTATHKIPSSGIPAHVKVNPDPGEQNELDKKKGWSCLHFSITQPIQFQYFYERDGNTATSGLPLAPVYTGTYFEASAKGDLNGNGVNFSTFARGGVVQDDGSLTLATEIYVDSPYE